MSQFNYLYHIISQQFNYVPSVLSCSSITCTIIIISTIIDCNILVSTPGHSVTRRRAGKLIFVFANAETKFNYVIEFERVATKYFNHLFCYFLSLSFPSLSNRFHFA